MYCEGFDDRADIEQQFGVTLPSDIELLVADYDNTYGDYGGKAYVLFRQGDRLFEVNGTHCSCDGLEGLWEPDETSVEALKFRLDNATRGKFAPSEDPLRDAVSKAIGLGNPIR